MEAKSQKIIDLIGVKNEIFTIPTYQRKFTWGVNKEIKNLLNDFEEYKKSEIKDYFLGSIIVKKRGGFDSEYILVDGQQRITTICLLLSAIIDSIDDKTSELRILISNKLKSNKDKFKLNRIYDEVVIKLILTGKSEMLNNDQKSSNYYKVYSHFMKFFIKMTYQDKNDFYENIIENIKLAIINLDTDEDEYLAFESINSKGKNLSSSDLIKNFIVMSMKDDENSIEEFENIFLKSFENNEEDLLEFYRQIFAIEKGILLSKTSKDIYYQFKDKFSKSSSENIDAKYIDYLIRNQKIWKYINGTEFEFWTKPLFKSNKQNFYAIIHLVIEYNSAIDINNNNVEITNKANIKFALKFLSKLVVARTLVGFGRVESNRSFAKIANELKNELKNGFYFKDAFQKMVIDKLNKSIANDRMPKIQEINDIDAKKNLYTLKNTLKWILIAIEYNMSGNTPPNIDKISIEHIFPQVPSEKWSQIEEASGIKIKIDNSELIEWLNTLGNLSITEVNQKMGNKTIKEKQSILQDKSYLKINQEIYNYENWGVSEVRDRAKNILKLINEIWFD